MEIIASKVPNPKTALCWRLGEDIGSEDNNVLHDIQRRIGKEAYGKHSCNEG